MRRSFVVCALLFSALIFSTYAAESPSGRTEYKSVEELATAIKACFPKLQGDITAVDGAELTLSLGKKDGLYPGVLVSVWREGKEIHHPTTGVVIGHAEEEIGTAEVTSVHESTSRAVQKKKLQTARVADRIRTSLKTVPIALVPARSERSEVMEELTERLNDSGRCRVLDAAQGDAFLRDRVRDDAAIKEIGNRFKLDAVVMVETHTTGGRQEVTAKVYSTEDARLLDTISAAFSVASGKDALGEIKPYFASSSADHDAPPALSFSAQFFAVADYDAEGRPVPVFSDGSRLRVYREEPAGWREIWTEAAPAQTLQVQHIYLDAADINNTGKPQLFVTAVENGSVWTSVYEQQQGTYRRIVRMPGFFRIVWHPRSGMLLLGQDSGSGRVFAGRPKHYTWKDGSYVAGPEIPVPAGVGLYDFIFADFGMPDPVVVAFDEKDHLIVYTRETRVWESREKYHGFETNAILQTSSGGRKEKIRVKGRMLALDVNGDGNDELIVARNGSGWLSTGLYKTSKLHALRWTGDRLVEHRLLKTIPGRILDIHRPLAGEHTLRLRALVLPRKSLFKKQNVEIVVVPVEKG